MQPTIEIDDEVFTALKANAEPLVDTANTVLRRVLGLEPSGEPVASAQPRSSKLARGPHKPLLSEREYELPILRYLDEHGGRAPSRDVTQAVGGELADKLTEFDRQPLKSGDIRWENRTAFVRLRLVERGELKDDSPRGTWEITEKGRERLHARP